MYNFFKKIYIILQNYREGEIDCENKYGSNKQTLILKKL